MASTPAGSGTPQRPKADRIDQEAHSTPWHVGGLKQDLQSKASRISKELGILYPDPPIPLDHESTFQLLVAVILSAQTTVSTMLRLNDTQITESDAERT